MHTYFHTYIQAGRQTRKHCMPYRGTGKQAHTHTLIHTGRETHRAYIHTQTYRQAARQAHIY